MQGIACIWWQSRQGAIANATVKTSPITHNADGIFPHNPDQLEVMRYHSLIAESGKAFPTCARSHCVKLAIWKIADFKDIADDS